MKQTQLLRPPLSPLPMPLQQERCSQRQLTHRPNQPRRETPTPSITSLPRWKVVLWLLRPPGQMMPVSMAAAVAKHLQLWRQTHQSCRRRSIWQVGCCPQGLQLLCHRRLQCVILTTWVCLALHMDDPVIFACSPW